MFQPQVVAVSKTYALRMRQIESILDEEAYLSGSVFLKAGAVAAPAPVALVPIPVKAFYLPGIKRKLLAAMSSLLPALAYPLYAPQLLRGRCTTPRSAVRSRRARSRLLASIPTPRARSSCGDRAKR
jgi:hypothetical protein